jgi:HAE1 family hydrophobic/amphiphilic exporter-1
MMRDMSLAIMLAVLFVYMILVSLFESYLSPFIIMFSIPVALVGGLSALAITDKALSSLSMIGLLLSLGLVSKNAILLVDYTNTLRAQGLTLYDALIKAGPVRLRPILMTTATMVCGMLPMAVGLGAGGNMRQGMGIVVIGSLLSSTLLTLVLVPVMYSVLEGAKARLKKILKGTLKIAP